MNPNWYSGARAVICPMSDSRKRSGVVVAQLEGMSQMVVRRAKAVLASLQRHKEDV